MDIDSENRYFHTIERQKQLLVIGATYGSERSWRGPIAVPLGKRHLGASILVTCRLGSLETGEDQRALYLDHYVRVGTVP